MKPVAAVPRAALLAAVGIAWALGAAAELMAIPGTKVSLDPPPDFALATQFPGVQNASLGSSIMVSEVPVSVLETSAGFTAEALLARGMTLQKSEEATLAGRSGRLLSVTQIANGAPFEKWMAVFGDSSSTVLVVATYPQSLASQLRAPMRTAVLSATWNSDAELDPFEGLSFRIRESERLKIQNRMQNMLLLTHPERSPTSASAPFAVVGSSYNPVAIRDLEVFARQRIAQTAQISDLGDIEGRSVEIAGRPAYEITATAKDARSGERLAVYQLLLVEGETYYLMQGMVGEGEFDDYLPEFRAVARSLEIP